MQTTHNAVTAAMPFFAANPENIPLLEVKAGVPIVDALNEVACMLEYAKMAICDQADESGLQSLHGIEYQIQIAEAIVNAVIRGVEQKGGEA